MNDNIYKLLIIYFFLAQEGIENSHIILSITGAIFVLPFILFSSSAGILADRFSKQRIIVATKALEVVIILIGLLGFIYSNKWISFATVFLLGMHSTLFSPSKYGILRELLPPERISRANGMMTSCTYLAIILGTFLASFLLDITGRNFIIAASFCLCTSTIGLLTSLCIQYTNPSGSRKRLNTHFISDIYKTLVAVRHEPSLIAAIIGSAFFLFLAAYVQLNMIPFAVQSLHLTDVQGGYLFLLTAIGIGTGSIISGRISGKLVELAIVPLSALGITVCFFLLTLFSNSLFATIPLVIVIGVFGGMYLIPLDSYIQIASPKQYIGQAVAASTFLSFIGVLCASISLYALTEVFGLKANQGFAILGFLTLIATGVYTFLFFDYLTRFIGMILSRLHFKITFKGINQLPNVPTLYLCTHTAWNDTLLLLGSQRRRMRFFIEEEQEHTKLLKKMYRLLRIVLITEIEPLPKNAECLEAIKRTLDKGISVCIFVKDPNVRHQWNELKHAQLVQEILQDTQCPLILVDIEKGEKQSKSPFFTQLMDKFRVPATVTFDVGKWEDGPSKESDSCSFSPISRNIYLKNLDEEEYQQV